MGNTMTICACPSCGYCGAFAAADDGWAGCPNCDGCFNVNESEVNDDL